MVADEANKDGGDPRIRSLTRALQNHQAGLLELAEAQYTALLAVDTRDADALHFLGLLRLQQRRVAEAESMIRASLDTAPHNAHAWNNLGNLLFTAERFAEAADAYIRAVDLDIEMAAPWRNLGECLECTGSPERAIALFRHIIETVPGFVPAYDALGRVLCVLGRRPEAIEVYRRWVELEPERATARHMLAAVANEAVPERASDAYVKELFDDFAADFDQKLARLKYQAPGLICSALADALQGRSGLDILDAGCGTGLCGPLLRPLAVRLVGIDLSVGMLLKARDRGCYDRLEEAELTTYLNAVPGHYDAVACVDTLCYFGNLSPVAAAARGAIRPGGLFAFSVEVLEPAASGEDYRIEGHGRFRHAVSYVARALEVAGWHQVRCQRAVLRQEVFVDVEGLVVVAS